MSAFRTVVTSSALVLSEPFGSGKTLMILAMILLRPTPKAIPVTVNSIIMRDINMSYRDRRNQKPGLYGQYFVPEITRLFIGPTALIRANLIVVGSSVLVQWEQAIKEFTSLRVLVVSDFHKLGKFITELREGKINNYDIILLKNGKVSGKLQLPGESEAGGDHRSMVTVIAKLTHDKAFARVFYDDADTISIPTGSLVINSLMTIYVSATEKIGATPRVPARDYSSLLEAFLMRPSVLNAIHADQVLFNNFNVSNTAEYTNHSVAITVVHGYQYVFANPNDNFIRLLGSMGEDDSNNIMEMLNGDAIQTAAELMGITSNSVADIFRKMLDVKYEKYIKSKAVLSLLDHIRIEVIPCLPDPEEITKYTMASLEGFRKAILSKKSPTFPFYTEQLDSMIEDMTIEVSDAIARDGAAVNRVIDNVREGDCQICALPLRGGSSIIVRCCGIIICAICGIKGNNIRVQYDYKTKSNTLCGACANCKTVVYPHRDLIFVDQSMDVSKLLSANDSDFVEPEPSVADISADTSVVASATTPEPEQIKNPKLKALLSIIRGETPEKQEPANIDIPHLIIGRADIPATGIRKIIVFAGFGETITLIEDMLVSRQVEFLRLAGTANEKAATVARFKRDVHVLLINSQQQCAGLNLQFATDIVYFHEMGDINVKAQLAGRAQRIGRTANLSIHYLLYKNETHMKLR
jgi:hypothetical protein